VGAPDFAELHKLIESCWPKPDHELKPTRKRGPSSPLAFRCAGSLRHGRRGRPAALRRGPKAAFS
jgi:hypothetical protein